MPDTTLPQPRLLDQVIQNTLDKLQLEALTPVDAQPGSPITISIGGLPRSGVLTRDLPIPFDIPFSSLLNEVELDLGLQDVKLTGGVTQTLGADLISKQMLFNNPTVALTDAARAPQNANAPQLPFLNLPALPARNPSPPHMELIDLTSAPRSAVEGVPGALGQVSGTLTTTLDNAISGELTGPITGGLEHKLKGTLHLPTDVPFSVHVKWKVCSDREGNHPLDAGDYRIDGPDNLPTVNIVLRPETHDWLNPEDGTPAPPIEKVTRYLFAEVTLSASDVAKPRRLGPVEISTFSLGIPRLLAMFTNYNFTGPCLIVVPERSPLGEISTFLRHLEPLQAVLSSLRSFAGFASLATGFANLLSGTLTNPQIVMRVAEGIEELNGIVLVQNDRWHNDMEANDEISSLILIGGPGATVQCYNAPKFKPDEGWFQLRVKHGFVAMIRNLHQKVPVTEPDGDFFMRKKDPAYTFGRTLSSVRFASPEAE